MENVHEISIQGCISKPSGNVFTEDEYEAITNKLIEFVESMGLSFGGGFNKLNQNGDSI